MEGQFGIINAEMGTPTTTVRPSAEAEGSIAVNTQPAITTQDEKRKSKEEQLNPEEIEKGLDKILDSLNDDPEKKKAFDQHLAELLLEHDEDNKKGEKLVETSAELLRFIKLLLALLIMFITNPKDSYSGEDFNLSDTPPEGDEGRELPGNTQDSRDSWKNIREGVQKIDKPLPFGEFMNLVLKINADNPVKKFKVKKEETKQESLFKRLIKQKLVKDAVKSAGRTVTPPQHGRG